MAFRDRFPTIEDVLRASAEDVGAELVVHIQGRRPARIHEGSIVGDLVHLYALPSTDERLLVVIAEAVAWARRSVLLVTDLSQTILSSAAL